jgi:F-type H+-transporting ATPase subunit epsilon
VARLDVHLVTPEREVWSGEASFVVVRGVDGDLGILPGHTPLLAALAVGPVFIDADGGRTGAVVDGGFLHVAHEDDTTRVDILAENAVLQDEVGGEDLGALERHAQELREAGEFDQARIEEAKVRARQRLSESS